MKSNLAVKYLILILFFLNTTLIAGNVLSMSQAYSLALKNSSYIKSLDYQLEAKYESYNQIFSKLYPQLNLVITGRKTLYEINSKYKTNNNNGKQKVSDYTFNLSQIIYDPEIYTQLKLETEKIELFKYKVAHEKQLLAKEVFEIYLNILKINNKIMLYKSYLEYGDLYLNSMTKKYNMNLVNQMDYLQAKVDYSNAKINILKEQDLLNVYKLQLNQLIGDNDFTFPSFEDVLSFDSTDFINIKQIFSKDSVLSNSLKLKQALSNIKIQEYDINNSFSYHLPKLSFEGTYSKYNMDNPTSDSNYDNKKQFMLLLRIPLYSGGFANAKVESSKLLFASAKEDYENTKQEVERDFKKYYNIFEMSLNSIDIYTEALHISQIYLKSVSQGLDNGLKNVIDLQEATNKIYEIRYKYLENIYEVISAYIELLILSNNFENFDKIDQFIIPNTKQ